MTCRLDEADRARVQAGTGARARRRRSRSRAAGPPIRDIALVARPDFTSFPPVRNFDVIVALDEADPRLRSGMSASARIELNRLEDVLVVPSAAIFQVDGGTVVYVVEGGSVDDAAGHGPAARPR